MGREGRSKNGWRIDDTMMKSCFHTYSDKCARFRSEMVLALWWLLKLNVLVRLHAFVLWTNACFAITSFIISLRIQIACDGFQIITVIGTLLFFYRFYRVCHSIFTTKFNMK